MLLHIAHKTLITGPESAGKTTLALQLAADTDSVYVAEYARAYLTQLDRPYRQADLDLICAGQLAAEAAMAQRYPRLVCDTGPVVLYVWSLVKYGNVSLMVQRAVQEMAYTEIILCYPDLPWTPDPLRETPDADERLRLFEKYEKVLKQAAHTYRVHQH